MNPTVSEIATFPASGRYSLRVVVSSVAKSRSSHKLDPVRDQTPVDFELRFAHSPHEAPAAALPLQVRPAAHQPRRRVLELREFHLELALVTLGALGEDVEDQTRAVDDRTAERLLEIALLRGR